MTGDNVTVCTAQELLEGIAQSIVSSGEPEQAALYWAVGEDCVLNSPIQVTVPDTQLTAALYLCTDGKIAGNTKQLFAREYTSGQAFNLYRSGQVYALTLCAVYQASGESTAFYPVLPQGRAQWDSFFASFTPQYDITVFAAVKLLDGEGIEPYHANINSKADKLTRGSFTQGNLLKASASGGISDAGLALSIRPDGTL